MTPEALSALHDLCFTTPKPWSAKAFAGLLETSNTFLLTEEHGFLLGRAMADEAELLTLAVHPNRQRHGIAGRLVRDFLDEAANRRAASVFLEVAQTNTPARALYRKFGFAETGRRPGYYRTPEGGRVDAILLSRSVSPQNAA